MRAHQDLARPPFCAQEGTAGARGSTTAPWGCPQGNGRDREVPGRVHVPSQPSLLQVEQAQKLLGDQHPQQLNTRESRALSPAVCATSSEQLLLNITTKERGAGSSPRATPGLAAHRCVLTVGSRASPSPRVTQPQGQRNAKALTGFTLGEGKGETQQLLDAMNPAPLSTKYKNKRYSTMCPHNTESVEDIPAT